MTENEKKHQDHLEELVEKQTIELRESKERFRSLYENMTLGMYRTTPSGQIIMANPALISLLGYDSFEELKKRNLEESGFEPEYPREKFKEEIKKNGKVQGLESKWKRRDGTSVFIRESAKAIKDEKGNIIYYDGTVEDITERKSAEEALRNSEEKYRTLTETLPDIIFTLDKKGRFTYISPAVENIVGYSSRGFLGHNFTEILAPEHIDATKDRFKRGLSGEKFPLIEVEIMHKNGRKVPVEYNVTSLFDKDGNIIGRFGVARDITESKRIEKMLRESESRYRTIFENTGTATMIIEEDKTISLINKEAKKLYGYSKKEIEGKKKWTEFVVEEDLEKMKGYHEQRRVDSASVPKRYEFRLIDKKGSIRDILLSIDVIPGTKTSVASLLDITERKQAENRAKHLNLVLHAIRNVNQLITREKDINKLLKGACNILVKTRGYYYIWIALLDDSEKLIKTAESGLGKKFIPLLKQLKKGGIPACGIKALKQPDVVVTMDPTSECSDCPLSGMYGGRGTVTFRLEHEGKIYGLASVSIPAEFAADKEEHALFKEVVSDLAFAIHNIELGQIHRRDVEQIKASLKEKEVLLREIHHRVKNNMQIVSSLLRLQSAKAEDKKTQEIFRECQNRISTMAIIHEKLYQSKDLAKINFAQYIDRLAVHIYHSYGVDSNIIALKTDLEEVFLDLNRAIPCGLIANELLSNSVKHAFPEGKKGEICIKLYSDKKGTISLVVSNDGIGFPKDIDFRKASSLGLQMVNDLTRQIDGTIELDRNGGTSFKVEFSVSK